MDEKEYIERGAFDRELQNLVREYNKNCESDKSAGAFEALYRLRLAPAADVKEVVHGEWIYKQTYYEIDECNCSLCGQLMTTAKDVRKNYCPNCGAKMDGGAP